MRNDNIDHIFQDKLKDLKVTPSDQAWAKLEGGLPQGDLSAKDKAPRRGYQIAFWALFSLLFSLISNPVGESFLESQFSDYSLEGQPSLNSKTELVLQEKVEDLKQVENIDEEKKVFEEQQITTSTSINSIESTKEDQIMIEKLDQPNKELNVTKELNFQPLQTLDSQPLNLNKPRLKKRRVKVVINLQIPKKPKKILPQTSPQRKPNALKRFWKKVQSLGVESEKEDIN